jgi:multiple sugar transport system substrate-binding protein
MRFMHRRQLLKASASAILFSPLVSLLSSISFSAHAKIGDKPIKIMVPALPYFDLVIQSLKKFSKDNNTAIEIDVLPYLEMRNIQLAELEKKQGKYDLIIILAAWKTEYAALNLLTNLSKEQKSGKLKLDDASDFIPAYLTVAGKVGGERGYLDGPDAQLFALPMGADTSILAYRSDIFKKHNWKPPVNYDELLALLPLIRKHEPALIPLCSRGARGHQITHAWLLHFNAFGGEVFDKKWRPSINNAAGLKAIEVLKAINASTSNGILNNLFADMGNAFITGNAVMYLDSSTIFAVINDPVKSMVQDKVNFTLHPKGTVNSSETGGFAIAIPKNTTQLGKSLQLLANVTGKIQERAMARKGGIPSRTSTLNDTELLEIFPEYAVLAKQLEYANPNWRPIIPEWANINEQILGTLIHDAVAGLITPTTALAQAEEKMTALMKKSGRYRTHFLS